MDITGLVEPFAQAKIFTLYPGGKAEFLGKATKSLDAATGQGFVLNSDRAEIVGLLERQFKAATNVP